MPSEHQPAATTRHASEAERFLVYSNRRTIGAVIRGMADRDRVQEWLDFEVRNQRRKWVVGALNQRKQALE